MNSVLARKYLQEYVSDTVSQSGREDFLRWLQQASDDEVEEMLIAYESILASGGPKREQAEKSGLREHIGQMEHTKQTALSEMIESVLDREAQMIQLVPGVLQQPPALKRSAIKYTIRYAVAASILIIFTTGAFLWWNRDNSNLPTNNVTHQNIPLPGSEGAVLTLSDGRKIILDSVKAGVVATEVGSSVILQQGQLTYANAGVANKSTAEDDASFNVLATPSGRKFQLMLPDGTRVWLNASSSIKYPTQFNKAERKVEIEGEVYFEVAANKNSPFRVVSNKQITEVIGTSFNINAYENEPATKVTLVDGAIKVQIKNQPAFTQLIPGQQAIITHPNTSLLVRRINTTDVIAWKNNLFVFDRADISTIMRQVARWYGVEVEFASAPSQELFRGQVPMSTRLPELLKVLELSGVKCVIGAKKITVYP